MKIALYVDDIRNSIDDSQFRIKAREFGARIVQTSRTYDDAIKWIEESWDDIVYISLDHDLGEDQTGYDIACHIENLLHRCIINQYHLPELRCHSANPAGRENIVRAFQSIERFFHHGEK